MTCNKMSFDLAAEARKEIKRMRATHAKAHGTLKGSLTVYKCVMCDRWHLTSARKKLGRKEVAKRSKAKVRGGHDG